MEPLIKRGWIKISPPEVFPATEDLLLTLPDKKFPIKFNAQIEFVDHHSIGLNLPENWWKIVPFVSGMPVSMVRIHRGGMYSLLGKVRKVDRWKIPAMGS